jgi:hypothetical protein
LTWSCQPDPKRNFQPKVVYFTFKPPIRETPEPTVVISPGLASSTDVNKHLLLLEPLIVLVGLHSKEIILNFFKKIR